MVVRYSHPAFSMAQPPLLVSTPPAPLSRVGVSAQNHLFWIITPIIVLGTLAVMAASWIGYSSYRARQQERVIKAFDALGSAAIESAILDGQVVAGMTKYQARQALGFQPERRLVGPGVPQEIRDRGVYEMWFFKKNGTDRTVCFDVNGVAVWSEDTRENTSYR